MQLDLSRSRGRKKLSPELGQDATRYQVRSDQAKGRMWSWSDSFAR